MNTVIKFIKCLREGVMISLFLSARFADKSHADSCEGRRPFFADNFNAVEIISLAKYGQAKIA